MTGDEDLPFDPGAEAVDAIFDELLRYRHKPSDFARQVKRVRAHIRALRERPDTFDELCEELADTPLTTETPGVAMDALGDEIILLARRRQKCSANTKAT